MKPARKTKLWLNTVGALVLVVSAGGQLASFWLQREGVRFSFDRDSSAPIPQQLRYRDWGGYLSVTGHDDPNRPGYIMVTHQQWCVGPLMWRRIVHCKPGFHD